MDSWIWVHMNCLVVAQVCLEVYFIALKSRVYFVLFLVWARCLIGWRSAANKQKSYMPSISGADRTRHVSGLGNSAYGPAQFGHSTFILLSFFGFPSLFCFSFFTFYFFYFFLFCSEFEFCSNLKLVHISNFVQI
jgi:hypothetical protein